jgi:glyoxylase-like metal-dependent hydrolase (beta-lactamase superfamily II)
MKKTKFTWIWLLLLLPLVYHCGPSDDYVVLHQKTGPIKTNCYLLVDTKSGEAALFDVGGPVDSLVTYIFDNNLKVKYIFATHCHFDHIEGVPQIEKIFPDALIGYNRKDYLDLFKSREWMEANWDPDELSSMRRHPEMGKWFETDFSIFREPDIYLEDNQVYRLGDLDIRTFLSPGHSAGSICFYAGDVLFTGDILFYRGAGRTDLLAGSVEALVRSVRRLYAELPDRTKVYPGHGRFTDIGSEKVENRKITVHDVKIE